MISREIKTQGVKFTSKHYLAKAVMAIAFMLFSSVSFAAAYITTIQDQSVYNGDKRQTKINYTGHSSSYYYLYLQARYEGSSSWQTVYSRNGSSTSAGSISIDLPRGTHSFRFRRCYRGSGGPVSCSYSATKTHTTVVYSSLDQKFIYDDLGRLTYVEDNRQGMNRDYDYDAAGNRISVSSGTESDEVSSLKPTAPSGLRAIYSGNCYFRASWIASSGGVGDISYVMTDSKGYTTSTTSTNTTFYCTYNKYPPDVKPASLRACNVHGCSATVNF